MHRIFFIQYIIYNISTLLHLVSTYYVPARYLSRLSASFAPCASGGGVMLLQLQLFLFHLESASIQQLEVDMDMGPQPSK